MKLSSYLLMSCVMYVPVVFESVKAIELCTVSNLDKQGMGVKIRWSYRQTTGVRVALLQ
jgi:hypothetical protein